MSRVLSVLSSPRLFILPACRFSLPRDVKYDHGPSFYVIPEISGDLSKGVPTMDFESLPKIESITPDMAFNGFSRLLVDYQLCLSRLSEDVKRGDIPLTSNALLHSLEEIFYPVEHGFQTLHSILSYSTDPLWPLVLGRLYRKLRTSRTEYFRMDPDIYRALLTVRANDSALCQAEKAMLEVLILECWRHGSALALAASGSLSPQSSSTSSSVTVKKTKQTSDDVVPDLPILSHSDAKEKLDRLHDLQAELQKEEQLYQGMVWATSAVSGTQTGYYRSTGRYPNPTELTYLVGAANIPVAESDLAPSTPPWLPVALGGQQNGGHIADMKINIASDAVVQSFLCHCSTRQVRQIVWSHWVQRSSLRVFGGSTGQHASNDSRMQTIRRMRRDIAESLGCEDWLGLMWRSPYMRMPTSSEALVSTVLEPLRTELKPMGQIELQLLSEWSSAYLDLPGTKLEAWDIAYAIEQYNFAASDAELQTMITPPEGGRLTTHVHTLLDQLANLFRLQLVPSTRSDTDLPVYNLEDMDDGKFFGQIIFDLFHQPGRPPFLGVTASVPIATRTRLSTTGTTIRPKIGGHSVSVLLGDLPPTAESEGCQAQELISIAAGFGACLQHLIPENYHHHINGLSSCLASDMRYLVRDLCGALMLNSILPLSTNQIKRRSKPADRSFSSSVAGLRPPPGNIIALPLLRQLYEARFDLALWTRSEAKKHWITLDEQLWAMHLPYPRNPNDVWPCSAGQLFGPNSEPGFQYQHVWRQILLQDVLGALQEHGWPDKAQAPEIIGLLKHFRDTVIAAPNLATPSELFREFRGRDPAHSFLLKMVQSRVKLDDSHVHLDPLASSLVRE
ncbi:Oligopeptidase A [Clonorchis sinensis]|uniref:Oligopeptidase A n=2 Tax=Clonorchis sinensis TaxID=79923 RepID=A0A8T1MUW6_CLOSI|nr:Oligopeptidase A [Clonorchis sinensis]